MPSFSISFTSRRTVLTITTVLDALMEITTSLKCSATQIRRNSTTQNELLCWIGVGLIAMSAVFSLVTLPVEYNASARALEWLQVSRTMQGAQLAQAREALSWAARTYLVAALSAIASVLYYVFLILGRRD